MMASWKEKEDKYIVDDLNIEEIKGLETIIYFPQNIKEQTLIINITQTVDFPKTPLVNVIVFICHIYLCNLYK